MASPTLTRKSGRKNANSQNIKVFVRCRPLNSIEKNSKSFSCIDVQHNREIVVKERSLDKFTKTFTFDRVFGPDSKQIDVYKAVAKNSVEEVLNGFNCTIFAYGQTGTGKTFTMEGEKTSDNTFWDDDPMAGIIPRCVNHLFDELRIQKLEFTMRVSFLELYNEELFDLLTPSDDMSKLRLYEDTSRKGSCIIQGLEEVLVRSKANVYEVLEKGSNKRQTAATLMNAQSSRSHTVFTVTLHIKENTVDGDELLKTGKLHLVDLAGSENIGRSGAVDKRAREAGNINMSLLTLGRVITALVEKTPHVPYRESKLTRLLQDALGGRTKTSIIATISPASVNLEETLSTLDYAHRAKNIQNRPEVNQKLNKKELIGEYSQEIERLRLDLMAMREKSGVYLANENYQDMIQTMETQAQEIMEKINHIRSLEEGIEQKTSDLNSANTKLDELAAQFEEMKEVLQNTKEVLSCTQKLLHETAVDRDEQKYLVTAHIKTEDKLHIQGRALVELAGITTGDLSKLHAKLDRKTNVEETNIKIGLEFQENYSKNIDNIRDNIIITKSQHKESLEKIASQLGDSVNQCKEEVTSFVSQLKDICQNHVTYINNLQELHKTQIEKEVSYTNNFCDSATTDIESQQTQLRTFEQIRFLPAIEKLAVSINTEATLLASLHKTVNDKLMDLNAKCEGFIKEQSSLVTNLESQMQKLLDSLADDTSGCVTSFKTLCSSVDIKLKNLNAKAVEMEGFMISLREIGNGISWDIDNTKSTLPTSLSNMAKTAESAKTLVGEFSVNCEDKSKIHKSYFQSLVSETQTTVNNYNSKIEQNIQRLGEERCEMESVVSQQGNDNINFLDSINAKIQSVKQNVEESAQESITEHTKHMKQGNLSIEKDQENLISLLESEYSRLEADLFTLKAECNMNSTSLQRQMVTYSEQLGHQKAQVLELFEKKMLHDIPTGETPIRKDYKYSRILATTSPHDRILERHRMSSANTMSKIPLPGFEDDTEDEVSSPSFESSLLSASDVSQVDDDISETKSLFGSVSEIHTNSGCMTDLCAKTERNVFVVPSRPTGIPVSRENSSLALSRSSSTSSIPEIKDKENSSVVQRGSNTQKRGLKQPSEKTSSSSHETTHSRSRKVLGMQN